jgi:hypothetical protein
VSATSIGYVEALILGTPKDQRTKPDAVKQRKGFTPEHIARLGREMKMLARDFKAAEPSYGENVLHLTLASAYIRKLLANAGVAAFLKASHEEIHAEFAKLAATEAW